MMNLLGNAFRSYRKSTSFLILAVVCMQGSVTYAQTVHKAIFEVTSGDPKHWEAALNNVENTLKALGKESTEIEVVAHGEGLNMLKEKGNASAERLGKVASEKVKFVACENTIKRKNVSRKDLLDFSGSVDSGVAEVIRKQENGWAYVKSGQ